MERTQVQARWADPSDLPTHSNTFHKQDDHQHNQSAVGWAASGLCSSAMDRDLGARPPLELWRLGGSSTPFSILLHSRHHKSITELLPSEPGAPGLPTTIRIYPTTTGTTLGADSPRVLTTNPHAVFSAKALRSQGQVAHPGFFLSSIRGNRGTLEAAGRMLSSCGGQGRPPPGFLPLLASDITPGRPRSWPQRHTPTTLGKLARVPGPGTAARRSPTPLSSLRRPFPSTGDGRRIQSQPPT